ncbi:Protein of uncharacterised function (DUF551) [Serratia ficaria]|uniref:DUF551 domain-containing protein n=1 Tax=Serratia ficaria TaxID=61651 RepID=UPI0021775222|nr:DUF551 domain-containing protein [Serratia ficaria]CAI1769957.1 Protein of uncharacterised function (DUF551) [Serratia ficaria]CAI2464877.1 Protein of uncharacterised function (DUF551) [Serratia ficaria]
MDKLRAEFEKWLEETHGLYGEDVEWQEERNCYAKFGIHLAYQAWRQSANSPETPDGWVSCSERLPDTDGNYWGWWSESKRQGPVWFIKSDVQAQFQSSEITHWMPLPAHQSRGKQ